MHFFCTLNAPKCVCCRGSPAQNLTPSSSTFGRAFRPSGLGLRPFGTCGFRGDDSCLLGRGSTPQYDITVTGGRGVKVKRQWVPENYWSCDEEAPSSEPLLWFVERTDRRARPSGDQDGGHCQRLCPFSESESENRLYCKLYAWLYRPTVLVWAVATWPVNTDTTCTCMLCVQTIRDVVNCNVATCTESD